MLKKKLADLLHQSEENANNGFEILRDPTAANVMGGSVCGALQSCTTFNGSCPDTLTTCGGFTEPPQPIEEL